MPQLKGAIPWNKGKETGLTEYHKSIRKDDTEVFVENGTYPRHKLKNRIIKFQMLEYKCQCCGIDNIWNGKEMPMILDHINGVNNDNRLENLRFVCSNCDSTLPTYKNRRGK